MTEFFKWKNDYNFLKFNPLFEILIQDLSKTFTKAPSAQKNKKKVK